MTPFPQVGEGELRVFMKREIINSDYEMRLVSLRQLQSATGEELRPLFFAERTLLPSVLDRVFKGEL